MSGSRLRRFGWIAALGAFVSLACSCKHGAATDGDAGLATTVAPTDAAVTPADQLAPGELVEGTDKAFGLPLPTVVRVELRVGQTVTARGHVTAKQLATFVQKRVGGGTAKIGNYESSFVDVKALGDPNRPLIINIHTDPRDVFSTIDVIDDTQTPIAPIPPTEAYQQNGITRDNKLTNPLDLR